MLDDEPCRIRAVLADELIAGPPMVGDDLVHPRSVHQVEMMDSVPGSVIPTGSQGVAGLLIGLAHREQLVGKVLIE